MGNAQRSFAAFRLTKEEREEVSRNDSDWLLDPETGVLEPEAKPAPRPAPRPVSRPQTTAWTKPQEPPRPEPKPFQVPKQTFD
jgi:hypothetical protein